MDFPEGHPERLDRIERPFVPLPEEADHAIPKATDEEAGQLVDRILQLYQERGLPGESPTEFFVRFLDEASLQNDADNFALAFGDEIDAVLDETMEE